MSITEVAKAAGVSTATVSRVLNDFPGVSEEAARQVRAAVDALHYKRQRIRRSRKGGNGTVGKYTSRTGNIAVITLGQTKAWLQLPIMAAVVGGIQRGAAEYGLRLILDELPDPLKPSPLVQGRQIDGAVVFLTGGLPTSSYEPILSRLRERVPIVWAMGMELTAAGVDHIAPDNISTGYLAHSYLVSEGCQELAYITADPTWRFMRLRGQAFLNAAYDSGRQATAYVVTTDARLAESYGRRVVAAPDLESLVAAIAKAQPKPTGLFVANDETTSRLYPLLAKRRLRIGSDVTLVSCDNEEIRLSTLQPRPMSIDLRADEIGFRAVIRLISRLQRPSDPPLVIQVTPRLASPSLA